MSDANVTNLSRITLGMDEGEVRQKLHTPYKEETVQLKDDLYDVWFYVTNPAVLGQTRMVHYNLTPLTFRNDLLVSVGWDYYQQLIKSKNNLANISRVSIGMYESLVRPIMQIPDKQEIIRLKGDQYEVWFYMTRPNGTGQASTTGYNFTPLMFKNNRLVSFNYDDYAQIKSENQGGPTTPGAIKDEDNAKALEKALEVTPSRSAIESKETQTSPQKGPYPPAPPAPPNPAEAEAVEKAMKEQPAATTPIENTELENALAPENQPVPVPTPVQKESKPVTFNQIAATPSPEQIPEESQESSPEKQKGIDMNEGDEDRIQEGQDENFDFW